jgi:hypothetical protein
MTASNRSATHVSNPEHGSRATGPPEHVAQSFSEPKPCDLAHVVLEVDQKLGEPLGVVPGV